jgi:FMN-dependent NADH-azoreductase
LSRSSLSTADVATLYGEHHPWLLGWLRRKLSGSGGVYSTSEMGQALEHQESYLKTVFGFLGITDVSIVRAEGVAMGDEAKAKALASAGDDIVRAAAGAAANQEAALAA